MQDGKLFTKFGDNAPQEVIQLVMAGELPTRSSKVQSGLITQTPTIYSRGLVELLGLIQEEIIEAGLGDSLVGGKLKLSQYFDFKGDTFLDLPEKITHLLQKLSSPNKKSHALAGFLQLLKSLDLYASSQHAFALFMKRYEFNS